MYVIKLSPGEQAEIVELDNVASGFCGNAYAKCIDPAGLFFAFVDEMVQECCAGEGGYYCRATGEHLYGTVFVTRHDHKMEPCSIHEEDVYQVVGLLRELGGWEDVR